MSETQFELSTIEYIADAFLGWNNEREIDHKLQTELTRIQTYLICSPNLPTGTTVQKMWPLRWDKEAIFDKDKFMEAFNKMPNTLPKQQ